MAGSQSSHFVTDLRNKENWKTICKIAMKSERKTWNQIRWRRKKKKKICV